MVERADSIRNPGVKRALGGDLTICLRKEVPAKRIGFVPDAGNLPMQILFPTRFAQVHPGAAFAEQILETGKLCDVIGYFGYADRGNARREGKHGGVVTAGNDDAATANFRDQVHGRANLRQTGELTCGFWQNRPQRLDVGIVI